MAIVKIPSALRNFTSGKDKLELPGVTVEEIISNLEKNFPGFKEKICTPDGQVRAYINIFVGNQDIRTRDGLKTIIKEKDDISIIPAIAGGSLGDKEEPVSSDGRSPGKLKVRIPTPLQKFTKNQTEVEGEGETIGELIENLEKNYPGIKERIIDENGKIRRFINIYVNEEDIRFLQNEKTKLNDGDEVSIIPAIAGGGSAHFVRSPFLSEPNHPE